LLKQSQKPIANTTNFSQVLQLFKFTIILFIPEKIMILKWELIGNTYFDKEKQAEINCISERD